MARIAGNVVVTLPTNTAELDGSGSTDDKGIVTFLWTRDENSPAAGVSGRSGWGGGAGGGVKFDRGGVSALELGLQNVFGTAVPLGRVALRKLTRALNCQTPHLFVHPPIHPSV